MTKTGGEYQDFRKDFSILKQISSDLIQENAELKNELDEKERELNLLYKVLREITYSMDWFEIQKTLLDIVMDFFPVVRFCMIALFDAKNEGLAVKMTRRGRDALDTGFLKLPFKIDEDTMWDEVVASPVWSEYFHSLDLIRNMQTSFIPLQLKTRELGFLMVCKPADVEYGKGEWRFLSTIANHLSMTLENAELYHFATTDQLTGLYNRRYFKHRLEREIERMSRRGESLCLLMFDIDHFKQVNDTYGHQAGDEVLMELSRRVREFIGDRGFTCRYGGEEFISVISRFEPEAGAVIAEELRCIVGDNAFKFQANGGAVSRSITVSVGVSAYGRDGQLVDPLIAAADQALYLAKARGRNCVVSRIPD